MKELSQHPTTAAALPPTQELAVWLRALRSFFNAANRPLTDSERASLGERSFKCETGVVRDALVRCLHLLSNLARGEEPPAPDATQTSPRLHALPSSHARPTATRCCTPATGSHKSSVQGLWSSTATGVP